MHVALRFPVFWTSSLSCFSSSALYGCASMKILSPQAGGNLWPSVFDHRIWGSIGLWIISLAIFDLRSSNFSQSESDSDCICQLIPWRADMSRFMAYNDVSFSLPEALHQVPASLQSSHLLTFCVEGILHRAKVVSTVRRLSPWISTGGASNPSQARIQSSAHCMAFASASRALASLAPR